MGKSNVKESQETSKQISSDAKGNSKKQEVVANANERPDWLPDGWNVEVKLRKSGTHMGSPYKLYIDPLKGLKFYSKPEVLRYLETVKDNKTTNDSSCTPKEEKKCTNMDSPSKILDNITTKDSTCTPKKEIPSPSKILDNITTKDSICTPKKEKKCTNMPSPSNILDNIATKDSTCTPKMEKKRTNMDSPSNILENIATKDSSLTSKEEKKCTDMPSPTNILDNRTVKDSSCTPEKERKCTNIHSPSNVVVEKSTVEDLPPGWIKEVKIRKSGSGTKKDPYYKDPVSGYVFRSRKDVQRYLESGDIGSCAYRPSRRKIQNEDNLTALPTAKRQNLKQSASKQQIFVAKKLVDKSSVESADVNNSSKGQDVDVPSGVHENKGESIVKMHSPEDGAANRPENCADDVQEKEHVVNMMENINEKNHSNHRTSKNKEFNVRQRSSQRLAGAGPVQLANNVVNEQALQVPKRNMRKSRSTQDVDMESKSSQDFSGVPDIMQKVAVNTGNDLSQDHVVSKEQHQLERDKTEDNKPGIHANSNKSGKKKEHCTPRRASNRLAGLKQSEEGRPVTELGDQALIDGDSGSRRIKSPKIPPTADNQLEKHEEMDDEKSEPQLSFAFHYSWSDPSVEFAINTVAGVLPPVESSVVNGPTTVPETDVQKTLFDNVTARSKDNQNNSVDKGPTTVPATDILNKVFDNVTGISSGNQNNMLGNVTGSRVRSSQVRSNKSKRKREVNVPMRLSKRLAGVEPDVPPSERALEYSAKKSYKEPTATATATLTDRASETNHLDAGGKTKLTNSSGSLETKILGESSNKCEKSYDAQTVHKEQLPQAGAENTDDERSEPQASLPFGDSWSTDPCLDYAFKTLFGSLPDDSAATDNLPVMTPAVNELPNKELHGRTVMDINGEAQNNSNQWQNKKELNMDAQPSKSFLGPPELKTSSTSYGNAPKFTTGESHTDEANMIRNWDREPLQIESGNGTQFVHHSSGNINTQMHGDPLQKNVQVVEGEFGTAARPPLQTETFNLNHDNNEFGFDASFMNSWSDPCLEFAYKTLTGEIPVEGSTKTQGCVQQPASGNEQRDDGLALPDFGFSSFSQSDNISFQYDIGTKSIPGQQSSSMSSSFPSTETPSLPPGFESYDSKKYYSQYNKNFQR